MIRRKVLVIGLGRFGTSLAEELWEAKAEVIVVDKDPEAVEAQRPRASAAFVADAADPGVLEGIGAKDVDVAVVTSGEDFEGTVLCVAQLAKLGVKCIFARAANDRQAHVLRAVGATRAVEVENEMGRRVAVHALNPVGADLIDFAMHFRVVPWVTTPRFVGRTLSEASFRNHGINVIGYFRENPGTRGGKPRLQLNLSEYRIEAGDTLLLVGEEDAVERFLGEE